MPHRIRESSLDAGRRGEDAAEAFLKNEGYRVLERNVRAPFGEIDFIAVDKETVCFVEVRSRSGRGRHADALASVGPVKQRRLSRLAVFYLKEKGWLDRRARFDVVAVGPSGQGEEIVLVKDAFPVSERYR